MRRLFSFVLLGALSFWACSCDYSTETSYVEIADISLPSETALSSAIAFSSGNLSSGALLSSALSSSSVGSSSEESSSSAKVSVLGLPPAGFYKTLNFGEPKASQGGSVSCTMDGSEPKELSSPVLYSQTFTKNTVVRCYAWVRRPSYDVLPSLWAKELNKHIQNQYTPPWT